MKSNRFFRFSCFDFQTDMDWTEDTQINDQPQTVPAIEINQLNNIVKKQSSADQGSGKILFLHNAKYDYGPCLL